MNIYVCCPFATKCSPLLYQNYFLQLTVQTVLSFYAGVNFNFFFTVHTICNKSLKCILQIETSRSIASQWRRSVCCAFASSVWTLSTRSVGDSISPASQFVVAFSILLLLELVSRWEETFRHASCIRFMGLKLSYMRTQNKKSCR